LALERFRTMEKILAVIGTGFCMHERRNTIEQTWGKDIDHIYFSDHEANNIIKVTSETEYRFGELKQVNIINMFPSDLLEKYEWVIFVDDDTFVNAKLLKENLQFFDANSVHGRLINCWHPDLSLYYPSGGAGFVMSTKLIKDIKGQLQYLKTGFGDVTLGIFFREKKINLIQNDLFKSHTPNDENISDVENYFTFHYIKTFDEMNELYLKCN